MFPWIQDSNESVESFIPLIIMIIIIRTTNLLYYVTIYCLKYTIIYGMRIDEGILTDEKEEIQHINYSKGK